MAWPLRIRDQGCVVSSPDHRECLSQCSIHIVDVEEQQMSTTSSSLTWNRGGRESGGGEGKGEDGGEGEEGEGLVEVC